MKVSDFGNLHKGLLAGIAVVNVPEYQSMIRFAARMEEYEALIIQHRGKGRLDELKHLGVTTRLSASAFN